MGPTEQPRQTNRIIRARVRGSSMRPLLRTGQKVLIARGKPPRGWTPGQIAAVRRSPNRQGVLHRVVSVLPDGRFLTRGDNTSALEGPWGAKNLIGWMVAYERGETGWWQETPRAQGILLRLHRLPRIPRQILLRVWQPSAIYSVQWRGAESSSPGLTPKRDDRGCKAVKWENQELGSDVVALNRDTGSVVILNQAARAVYNLAKLGLTRDAIVDAFLERYPGAKKNEIAVDVELTMEKLRLAGMIEH